MPFDPDDFRLTAYALGELDAADRETIEAILHDDPDCRAFVAGIEETARLLSEELRHETTATFGLGPVRREAIEDRLATPVTLSITPARPSRLLGRVLLALAASVIGFVVGIFFQKAEARPRGTAYELAEASPSTSEIVAAAKPVMKEWGEAKSREDFGRVANRDAAPSAPAPAAVPPPAPASRRASIVPEMIDPPAAAADATVALGTIAQAAAPPAPTAPAAPPAGAVASTQGAPKEKAGLAYGLGTGRGGMEGPPTGRAGGGGMGNMGGGMGGVGGGMPGSRAAESEQLAKLGRVESLARTRLLVEDRKKSLAAAPTHGGANPANRGMAMRQAQDLAFDPFDARQAAPAAPQAQSAAPLPGQPGPQVAMQGLNPAAGVNSSPPAAPAQALAGPAGQNQQGTFLFLNQAPSPNPALSSPAQAQNMAGNGSQPGQAPQTANNGAVASNKPANAQKPDPAMQGSNFGIANAPQPAQPSEAKRPDPGSSALSTGLLAGRSVEPQKPSAKAPDQNASNAILQGMHGVDYAAIVQPQPGGIAYAKNFKDLAPQRQPGKPAEVKGNEPALLADLQPGGNNDKPNGANPGDKPVADAVVEAGKNTREDDVKRERDAELGQLRQEVEQVQQQAIRIQERAQREEYARFYDNPFRAVLPGGELSTFAIDVDTASYANVRRFLAQGQLPPADAVRIEEMVNYFSYDDPAPKGDDPFSVRVEVAACPWDPGHRLARIGLKGRTFDPAQRPPSNLVFLIDTSGSMADLNKLPLLKAGLKLMVEKLTENDRLGIVVYSNDTREALPSTPCHRKEAIFAAIDGLKAEGGTNGGAGIQLAYKMATDNLIKGGTNRVLLATDGDFNVGLTKEQLLAQSEERAKTGVFLSVLGFGEGNLQDEFMEQLADKGNGNYSYIDSIDEARKVLVRQLSATLDVIAKDVKIQLEFNPSRVGSYRLIGYENRVMANEDFRNDKKDAGEIGAGHSLTALYEIVPTEALAKVAAKERPLKYRVVEPAAKVNDSPELFTVFLRFKRPDGDTAKEISQGVTDDGRDFGHASADLKFSASVAGFGMLLRGSPYRGTLSYPAVLEIASSALGDDRSGDRKGFLDLIRQAEQATNGPGEIAR